jgi:hypothetical protein
MRRLKHVLKNAADVLPRTLVGVEPQRAMPEIQWSNVIESEDMISVTMRDQYGIKMLQPNLQSLLPKVTRRVDDDCLTGVFDED